MWQYTGTERPPFADQPGPGQESVWDFPRPPALSQPGRHIRVQTGDTVIADTRAGLRVAETASPPTWYVPLADVEDGALVAVPGSSFCEWKGAARYWALAGAPGDVVGWDYSDPKSPFEALLGHVCFYPGRVVCLLDGERVQPQPGEFYGGWVTGDLVGPFKGAAGTGHW